MTEGWRAVAGEHRVMSANDGRPWSEALPRERATVRPWPWQAACVACLVLFLIFGAHQLSLPGLQYDETKEAGLNAMQLVTGQAVTAFRDATVRIGPWQIPLMVQDYIGNLNVLLAVPFLAVGGVNPVALRWLPLLIGALTLWLAWRLAWRLGGPPAAAITALLLAVNPSFIFWSRQGIFVTNITAALFLASLLFALRWWAEGRPRDLWLMAFCWGLGIYAKLLFVWAIGAMVVVAAAAWLIGGRRRLPGSAVTWLVAAAAFLLPLAPLILFNIRTDGTLISIFGNLGHSYYGVNNLAYFANLGTRLAQLNSLLRGDHLWYLGEVYADVWAPWLLGGLAVAAVAAGLLLRRPGDRGRLPAVLLPLGLLALIVGQSAFTVSDLFITHDAMFLPLLMLIGGVAAAGLLAARGERGSTARSLLLPALALLAIAGWAGRDTADTLAYHRILARSGGYGSHSDAIYRLADFLEREAPSAPIALDWGLDAQLRFLSRGQVNPVEVFGYTTLDAPDAGFAGRAGPFLDNPSSVFVAHVPEETVFHGRVDALAALAAQRGLALHEEARFGLRSGKALFIVYRAVKGG